MLFSYFFYQLSKAIEEKEITQNERVASERKLENILMEFNQKLAKEKEIVLSNVDGHIKSLLDQVRIYL